MLEAIRTLISGIINHLDEFKAQGDATAQQVAGVHGELEAAMLKVNMNFKNMANDFNMQCWVINLLGKTLDDVKNDQRELRKGF